MPRIGVDYERIKHAAVKLLSQGVAPSVQRIREVLGTGSNTTIAEHLKLWRDDYAKKTIHHLPANMPKELISAFEVLWQTATEQAENQLAEYKKALELEREALSQKDRDSEKSISDMTQKIASLNLSLEQEVANKQKLEVELAVANERLSKQAEDIILLKNHYDDRLKHVYEERDNTMIQNQQLKNEMKSLQEQMSTHSDQHRHLISQQHTLHQQSEVRWSNLIAQSKQETKELQKKFEIFRNNANEQINQLKLDLSSTQQVSHEKSVKLKTALEQVDQLKQAIKTMEPELNDAKMTTIKLQEKISLQTILLSENKKYKDKLKAEAFSEK